MNRKEKKISVKTLLKEYRKHKLNFDLIIQRKDNIWDNKRKSRLIKTILLGYPMPPVYSKLEAVDEKEIKSFLDGKQRLTTIFSFINGEFKLDRNLSDINGEKVSNKKYMELPIELRNAILGYQVDNVMLTDITEEEMVDIFDSLNNGVTLNSIERSRPLLGAEVTKYLGTVCEHNFFKEKINISNTARKRYTDQEIALQCIKLIHQRNSGLTSKEIKEFVNVLRGSSIKDDLKSTLDGALFFTNEAFPQKETYLKKVNIPVILTTVINLYKSNNRDKIIPSEFKEFADNFFNETPEEYKRACMSGSAKKENVQKRINIFEKELYKEFKLI